MSYGNADDVDGIGAPMDNVPQTHTTEVSYYPAATPQAENILRNNVAALAARSRFAAIAVVSAAPTDRVQFDTAPDGGLTAAYAPDDHAPVRRLASARRPLDEAQRFAEAIDVEDHAAIAVLGFALGHHLAALVGRAPKATAVLCYEPDIALLRAVLERIDCSAWLDRVIVVTNADDTSELAQATRGLEGLLSMGTHIVEHGPSSPRLASTTPDFRGVLEQIMRGVRTTMATTMVQIETTVRNLTMNIDHYALGGGIAELHNIASGRPAIVVSAGPSLARNIELLKRPDVQQNFIVIAVQTVLKQLLNNGIKPHFVTALDRHKLSARFYEGLTPHDVEGVQLVIEPKCNPIIPISFPGVVRCASDDVLNKLLGHDLYRDHGKIRAGATVSHLAYYLARYLGCDPVILIGQDLGFTDNQYYSAGASIHDTWSCELGEFNTIETLEFQRIMRSRQILSRRKDLLGRDIYTEEQLHTYLVQFERDFMLDARSGLTVIDATEGGVAKANATAMTLAQAIDTHMPATPVHIPAPIKPHTRDRITIGDVNARLRDVRKDVWQIETAANEAADLLRSIEKKIESAQPTDALVVRVQEIAERTSKLAPAYDLVHHLNQTGTFRRVREDRSIELADPNDKVEIQRRQVVRDVSNVVWLCDSAKRLGAMLDATINCLKGGERHWHEMPERVATFAQINTKASSAGDVVAAPQRDIGVVVVADFSSGALGTQRQLDAPLYKTESVLGCTLARVARAASTRTIAILTDDVARAQRVVDASGHLLGTVQTRCVPISDAHWHDRKRAVAAARAFSPSSWRGGIGQLCVWDELCPGIDTQQIMERMSLDTVVMVGADWALVDPAMIDEVVRRIGGSFQKGRRAFAPAPPGIGPVALDRGIVDQLVSIRDVSGVFATVAATLGYIPVKPQPDPLAHDLCAAVPASVRDLGVRCVADTTAGCRLIARTIEALDARCTNWVDADAQTVAQTVATVLSAHPELQPTQIVNIAVVQRAGTSDTHAYIDPHTVSRSIEGSCDKVVAVTLHGADGIDALAHPHIDQLVRAARRAGAASVHVRSRLVGTDVADGFGAGAFAEVASDALPDVISADILSTSPARADAILPLAIRDGIVAPGAAGNATGSQWHIAQHTVLDALLHRRTSAGGLPIPWIVARLVKRDATYEDTEPFYNVWTMRTGSAVLDPLAFTHQHQRDASERITALPLPRSCCERLAREVLRITPTTHAGSLVEPKSGASHTGAAA